jgi:hypothetical protein
MKVIHRTTALAIITALCLSALWQSHALGATRTSSKSFGVYVNVTTAATVSLSGSTFTWNAIKPTVNSYVAASSGPMTVTGGIRTSPSGGAGSIVILSPGDIQGPKTNNTLPIKEFALTCSGNGNIGTPPVYAPALTQLTAKSTAPCASWGPGATTKLNFSFALYLQTQNVQTGVYQSSGFSIIATAT